MTTVDARQPLAQSGWWRGWLGVAVALAGVAVVLSPYLWSDAWTFSGFSLDYLGFYAWFWVPFAGLGAFAAWRDGLSVWATALLAVILAACTVRALTTISGGTLAPLAQALPALLTLVICAGWGIDAHLRLHRRSAERASGLTMPLVITLVLLVPLAVGAGRLADVDAVAELSTFAVIFASVVVEALPFVLLGALVSALIQVFVSDNVFSRVAGLPLRLQVPGLALCGMAMPVCECGSVPVARRLILRGVHPGAGVAFMLAAPIVNPVVLFSTAVAYSGRDALLMVTARAGLGIVLATAAGILIARMGAGRLLARREHAHDHEHRGRLGHVVDHLSSDFAFMGKFVVAGAALAAAMQTLVPQDVFTGVLTSPLVGSLLLMAFAFVLSLCSEADAFVAISFVQFPIGPQLAFLVFGPVLDIKLSLLYAATFGWGLVLRLLVISVPIVLAGAMLIQGVAG
jgi:uncharacterized membrane protein YraQ (UPF0718 family)